MYTFVKNIIDKAMRGQFVTSVAISKERLCLFCIWIQVSCNYSFWLRVEKSNNVLKILIYHCLCGKKNPG